MHPGSHAAYYRAKYLPLKAWCRSGKENKPSGIELIRNIPLECQVQIMVECRLTHSLKEYLPRDENQGMVRHAADLIM